MRFDRPFELSLVSVTLGTNRTIRRVPGPEERQAETYRYWQSLPIGERLAAVWDVSPAAYAFAAAFKEQPPISRDDLIRNKLATGREEDKLDVKKLRAPAEANPNNSQAGSSAPAQSPAQRKLLQFHNTPG